MDFRIVWFKLQGKALGKRIQSLRVIKCINMISKITRQARQVVGSSKLDGVIGRKKVQNQLNIEKLRILYLISVGKNIYCLNLGQSVYLSTLHIHACLSIFHVLACLGTIWNMLTQTGTPSCTLTLLDML